MFFSGGYGPNLCGKFGQNRPIVFVPIAAAMCRGPVSLLTITSHLETK